ncbi:MAG TPA: MarR family winged helix-turn-helix transcriptional regulator [Acetobacteraceae bacterium]|nr:MarR family winged helix-turn-helix transcriptional regulator [Acetobacteraceae bacterium]
MTLLRLPPTQLGRFADSVCFHLRRAHELTQQQASAALADIGLLPIHAEVLGFINDNPGTIPSVVADSLGRDRSSVTGILRTLFDQGLIDRTRTIRDRRAALLAITPAGAALLQRMLDRINTSEATLDRILGQDKPAFLDQLRRITVALTVEDSSDGRGDVL